MNIIVRAAIETVPVCATLASRRARADLRRIGEGADAYAGGAAAPPGLLGTDPAAEAEIAREVALTCEDASPPPPPPSPPCGGVEGSPGAVPGVLCSAKPCKGCEPRDPDSPPVNSPGDPFPNEAYNMLHPMRTGAHRRFSQERA